MKDFTFHGVEICIPARDGKEAYSKLCDALAAIEGADWHTDTYSEDGKGGEPKWTTELFPEAP